MSLKGLRMRCDCQFWGMNCALAGLRLDHALYEEFGYLDFSRASGISTSGIAEAGCARYSDFT